MRSINENREEWICIIKKYGLNIMIKGHIGLTTKQQNLLKGSWLIFKVVTIFVRKGWWSIFWSNWQYQGGHTSWVFLSWCAIDINTIRGCHICAVFDAITICTMQRCLVCFWNMVWRRQFIFCCAWRSHVVNMRNQRNCVNVNMCARLENIEWVLLVNLCA